jgi:hypothetical protein
LVQGYTTGGDVGWICSCRAAAAAATAAAVGAGDATACRSVNISAAAARILRGSMMIARRRSHR